MKLVIKRLMAGLLLTTLIVSGVPSTAVFAIETGPVDKTSMESETLSPDSTDEEDGNDLADIQTESQQDDEKITDSSAEEERQGSENENESIESSEEGQKLSGVDNENEKLPYQKMEFGRAKCAMFFPLYVDNVYIGYWIIEGSKPHEFDHIDTTILEVVRNNIVTILKTVENQATIENIVRDDLYSGLKSAEYLYGEGKKTIDKYTTSAICLFKIVNLPDINTQISRKTGDVTITTVSNFVKKNLAQEYVFVRYMGPKFAIVFSGADKDGVLSFMQDLKNKIEKLDITAQPDYINSEEEEVIVSPKIRVVISTYYKGTALDGAFKKLEEYIDSSNENTIRTI